MTWMNPEPPEPEPTREERVRNVVEQAIAGQGVVRRVLLYLLTALLAVTPLSAFAILPLILLMATDHDLS